MTWPTALKHWWKKQGRKSKSEFTDSNVTYVISPRQCKIPLKKQVPSPYVILGSFASKSVRINRREPPKLGSAGARPLAVEARLTARNTPSPTCVIKSGRSRSNGTSVIKEIRLRNLTDRVPHFKVTQGHRNRRGSIRHLWRPINVS